MIRSLISLSLSAADEKNKIINLISLFSYEKSTSSGKRMRNLWRICYPRMKNRLSSREMSWMCWKTKTIWVDVSWLLTPERYGTPIKSQLISSSVFSIWVSFFEYQNNSWRKLKFSLLVHLVAQLEKSSQINGVVVLMDFEGLSLKQVKALTPAYTKRLLIFIQDAMPVRLREIHFVKQPFIFNMVWTLFKPFVREKLKKRVWSFLKKMYNNILNDFLLCRCFSMATIWRSFTSTSQLNVCLRTMVELYRKSITQAKTGIHASKIINNILWTGQLSVLKMKKRTSSSFEYIFCTASRR